MSTSQKATMLLFLHFVLVTFVGSFTSAQVTKFHTIVQRSSLDGNVSDDHLLFLTDVSTKLGCASFCMRYNSCVAFSTSPRPPPSKMMECRVHDSKSIFQSSAVAAPGSKTYFTESGSQGSDWLEYPCTVDDDCPDAVTNAMCFAGRCLCQFGHYYSHSRDACVADCELQDLQSTYLKYPYRRLRGDSMFSVGGCDTYTECSFLCLNTSECRSFEFKFYANRCIIENTIGSSEDSFRFRNDTDHYQRTCL